MPHFLLFIALFSLCPNHGGHIAEYHYQILEEQVQLRFLIEQEVLMAFDFGDHCNLRDMTALCTSVYLMEHLEFRINGQPLTFEFQKAYTEADHFVLIMTAAIPAEEVSQIQIKNRCFYAFDSEFKNRILLNVYEFQGIRHYEKSFLLNQLQDELELNH